LKFTMLKVLLVSLVFVANTAAQYTGHGISKSTYSADDPITGWTFLNKYFPVSTPTDECANNICECPAEGSTPVWYIQQGRVYATRSGGGGGGGGHAGNGFGLHLVNVSNHLTTGGLSTAEVEAYFTEKLGDMTVYDSFMDYNVILETSGLAAYKSTFTADGVKFLAGTWDNTDGTSYTSIIVRVPGTQMILELVQATALTYGSDEPQPVVLEQRVPDAALQASTLEAVGTIITPLVVNRAASSTAMASLEAFYVDGMGTTMSHSSTSNGVTKKCFLWTGATVHACYTERPDTATSGSWKVKDFEDMLNTVHRNIIGSHPLCGQDKWEDNHYAIDSQTADTSMIIDYIDKNDPLHYCETNSQSGSVTLHYVYDPCGWGIQLDMRFSSAPSDCSSSAQQLFGNSRRLLQQGPGGHTNPACTTLAGACGTAPAPSPAPPSPPSPSPPSPTPGPSPTPTPSGESWIHKNWWVLAAAGGGALVILVAVLVYCCCCKKKQAQYQDNQYQIMP